MLKLLLQRTVARWRQVVLLLVPLVLLPLPIGIGTKEAKCAYSILIVTIFWMCEVAPLAVTSLLPVVLFPLFGILPTEVACMLYMKETNMMLLSGIIAAIAIENCNLHRRLALRIILFVGTSPKWLMLGFMGATSFLSMWISNTASAAMMVPIVESILGGLYPDVDPEAPEEDGDEEQPTALNESPTAVSLSTMVDSTANLVNGDGGTKTDEPPDDSNQLKRREREAEVVALRKRRSKVRSCILLSIAYAANLGGTGTLTGTGPNLVLMSNLRESYGQKTGLNFLTWMGFNVPSLIFTVLVAWLWLLVNFLGVKEIYTKDPNHNGKKVKAVIRRQYDEMGKMTFHEFVILSLFLVLIGLWIFRSPEFIKGWGDFYPEKHILDSVAGLFIVFLMFVAPSKPDFFCRLSDPSLDQPPPRALTWDIVQKRVPWGILLLMGGGFCIAEASKLSGLGAWMGTQLTVFKPLPPVAIVTIVCAMTAMLTEVASNTATATILMPVLADMSRGVGLHPLYLMLPAAVSCSYAFMLPIATPPNAIIYEVTKMKTKDMARPGFVMNLLCVGVIVLMINTLGVALFGVDTYPDWADSPLNITTMAAPPMFNATTAASAGGVF